MADLKINVDKLMGEINRLDADARERITRAAQDAIEEVRLSARTLPEIPAQSTDLLREAVMAEVGEVDLTGVRYGNPAEVEVGGACFETQGLGTVRLQGGHGQTRYIKIKPGKYRALFFLLPLPGEVKSG